MAPRLTPAAAPSSKVAMMALATLTAAAVGVVAATAMAAAAAAPATISVPIHRIVSSPDGVYTLPDGRQLSAEVFSVGGCTASPTPSGGSRDGTLDGQATELKQTAGRPCVLSNATQSGTPTYTGFQAIRVRANGFAFSPSLTLGEVDGSLDVGRLGWRDVAAVLGRRGAALVRPTYDVATDADVAVRDYAAAGSSLAAVGWAGYGSVPLQAVAYDSWRPATEAAAAPAGSTSAGVTFDTPVDDVLILYALTQAVPMVADIYSTRISVSALTLSSGCQCQRAVTTKRQSLTLVDTNTCSVRLEDVTPFRCDFLGTRWCDTYALSKLVPVGPIDANGICSCVTQPSTVHRDAGAYAPTPSWEPRNLLDASVDGAGSVIVADSLDASAQASPTATAVAAPTNQAMATTEAVTATPAPIVTRTASPVVVSSPTPVPTMVPTVLATPVATPKLSPVATPALSPVATPEPMSVATPPASSEVTLSPTLTPDAAVTGATAEAEAAASAAASAAGDASVSVSPTPPPPALPSATPSATADVSAATPAPVVVRTASPLVVSSATPSPVASPAVTLPPTATPDPGLTVATNTTAPVAVRTAVPVAVDTTSPVAVDTTSPVAVGTPPPPSPSPVVVPTAAVSATPTPSVEAVSSTAPVAVSSEAPVEVEGATPPPPSATVGVDADGVVVTPTPPPVSTAAPVAAEATATATAGLLGSVGAAVGGPLGGALATAGAVV